MNKEFITYKQALALKELGFDEECIASYDNEGHFKDPFEYNSEETDGYVTNSSLKDPKNFNASSNPALLKNYLNNSFTAAPLYQQAFRWFREKYNLRGFIGFRPNVKQFDCHVYDMSLSGKEYVKQRTMEEFNKDPKVGTYEEAEQACLNKLIEIVKNK